MNRVLSISFSIFICMLFLNPVQAQKQRISLQDLPQKSQDFVKQYFPDLEVIQIKSKTKNGRVKEYKLKLSGREKIEFDGNGDFYKVDMQCGEVPAGLLSKSIQNYVKENYPDLYITNLKMKRNYDEIEISNGLELEFSKEGKFLRIDD